jgi:hypothetical protein
MALASKDLLGIVLLLLLPAASDRRMNLVLARYSGQRFAGFNLANHLQLGVTGKLPTFERQGGCLLSDAEEA